MTEPFERRGAVAPIRGAAGLEVVDTHFLWRVRVPPRLGEQTGGATARRAEYRRTARHSLLPRSTSANVADPRWLTKSFLAAWLKDHYESALHLYRILRGELPDAMVITVGHIARCNNCTTPNSSCDVAGAELSPRLAKENGCINDT